MDHSLGALLAQNNDLGHEQAMYCLSRNMIGAEHRDNPIEKEYLAFGVRCPENVTLLGGPNYTCHIKSQSFKIAYDKAIITKWSIGEIGHIALLIWIQFLPQKTVKGQAVVDCLAEHLDPRATKLYEDLPR